MLNDGPKGGGGKRMQQSQLNTVMLSHERYLNFQGGLRAQLAHANIDGLNLANRKLMEADFSGASLVGCNLSGSNLERASFFCADLRDCNLQSACLVRADLRGASFNGAKLAYAKLDGADLRTAVMMFVGEDGVTIVNRTGGQDKRSAVTGVDFSNCSLKGASFGNAKLDNANFDGALLQGASFKNAQLANVSFRGAVLTGVSLKELSVPPGALEGAVRDVPPEAVEKVATLKARLESHQKWIGGSAADGTPAVLDGEDLRPLGQLFVGRTLSGLSARNAMAVGLDFSGSHLQAAKFDGADLRDADFSGADLRGASFKGARLTHARFKDANLGRLQMTSGSFLAPDFTDTHVTMDQIAQAKLDGTPEEIGIVAQ